MKLINIILKELRQLKKEKYTLKMNNCISKFNAFQQTALKQSNFAENLIANDIKSFGRPTHVTDKTYAKLIKSSEKYIIKSNYYKNRAEMYENRIIRINRSLFKVVE